MNKKLNLLFKMLIFIIISFLFVFCTLRISDEDEGVSPGLIILQNSSAAYSQFSSYNPYPSDDTAPIMTSITVNPADTSTTREIKISIGAFDSDSGVAYVICDILSPTEWVNNNGDKLITLGLTYNSVSKKWEGLVNFSMDSESGIWRINNISIRDKAGHVTNYYRFDIESITNYYNGEEENVSSFKFVSINVVETSSSSSAASSETSDNTPPVITEISVNPENTGTTRNITISIDANDDMSGINSLSFVVESPTEQQLGGGVWPLINVSCTFNSGVNKWVGYAQFPDDAETG